MIVQNRRNRHTFDTYVFTIDLVPLVFEKIYFLGHKFEYKWKNTKMHKHKSVKQILYQRRREAHLNNLLGQNTTEDAI
jgi:hypothetical protein